MRNFVLKIVVAGGFFALAMFAITLIANAKLERLVLLKECDRETGTYILTTGISNDATGPTFEVMSAKLITPTGTLGLMHYEGKYFAPGQSDTYPVYGIDQAGTYTFMVTVRDTVTNLEESKTKNEPVSGNCFEYRPTHTPEPSVTPVTPTFTPDPSVTPTVTFEPTGTNVPTATATAPNPYEPPVCDRARLIIPGQPLHLVGVPVNFYWNNNGTLVHSFGPVDAAKYEDVTGDGQPELFLDVAMPNMTTGMFVAQIGDPVQLVLEFQDCTFVQPQQDKYCSSGLCATVHECEGFENADVSVSEIFDAGANSVVYSTVSKRELPSYDETFVAADGQRYWVKWRATWQEFQQLITAGFTVDFRKDQCERCSTHWGARMNAAGNVEVLYCFGMNPSSLALTIEHHTDYSLATAVEIGKHISYSEFFPEPDDVACRWYELDLSKYPADFKYGNIN